MAFWLARRQMVVSALRCLALCARKCALAEEEEDNNNDKRLALKIQAPSMAVATEPLEMAGAW